MVIILVRAKLVHLVACKFTEEAMMSGSETRRARRIMKETTRGADEG